MNFSAGKFQSVEEDKDLQQSLQPHKDYQLKQVGFRTSALTLCGRFGAKGIDYLKQTLIF